MSDNPRDLSLPVPDDKDDNSAHPTASADAQAGGTATTGKPGVENAWLALGDAIPLPLVVTRAEDGRILYANQEFMRLQRATPAQVLGQLALEFYADPADRARILEQLAREGKVRDLEVAYRRIGDDTLFWAAITINPVVMQGEAALCVVIRDVTTSEHKQAEELLRRRAQEFQALVEHAPDLVSRFDRQLRHVYVNPAVSRATGRPQAEFLHKTNAELGMASPARERWDEGLHAVFANGIETTLEFELAVDERAAAQVYETRLVPEFGADGQVETVLSISRDITARKRRERESAVFAQIDKVLRQASSRTEMAAAFVARVHRLFAADYTMLMSVDVRTHRALVEAVLGEWAITPGSYLPPGAGVLNYIVTTGQPYLSADFALDPRTQRLDLYPPFQATVAVPLRLQEQLVSILLLSRRRSDPPAPPFTLEDVQLLSTIADMTASAMQRATFHTQIQQIVNTVGDGLVLLDQELRVLLVNPAGREYLARLAGVGVGERLTRLGERPFVDYLLPPAALPYHRLTLDTPQPAHFEVAAHPLPEQESLGGWVLALRDTTAFYELQQHMEVQGRLAAIGQLAAGIAHDFNNILAVILLYTQMLQQHEQGEAERQRKLGIIVKQADDASRLIQQILDFSRKAMVERSRLDLLPFVQELVKLWARILPETITVALHALPGEYLVLADPSRLQQALMNLAVNSRDAMLESRHNGGELSVHLAHFDLEPGQAPPLPEMEPGAWVRLAVADTGVGIAPEYLPHLFEPFFTTKEPGKGTGLGLAQVFGIVKQHGGHVQVTSEVDHGTEFALYLPRLVQQGEARSGLNMVPATNTVGVARGLTVLLVEDNAATRQVTHEALAALGCQVLTAENGGAALALLRHSTRQIDLVLSDVVMPQINGLEVAQQVAAHYPKIKVMLMTGYPMHEQARAGLLQGQVAWLQKPFSLEQLAQMLAMLFATSADA